MHVTGKPEGETNNRNKPSVLLRGPCVRTYVFLRVLVWGQRTRAFTLIPQLLGELSFRSSDEL